MAGGGAKELIKKNEGIVSRHRNVVLGSAAFCFLCWMLRLGSFNKQSSGLALFGLIVSFGVELAAFRLIALAVVPTYGEDGKIVYAGADLDKGGVTEHCFDIIYTVSFVHVSVVLWRYFWLLLLVIPGYAFFKLMKDVVIPWCLAPDAEDPSDGKRGKKEKRGRVAVGRR